MATAGARRPCIAAVLFVFSVGVGAQQALDDPLPERIDKGDTVLMAVDFVRAPRSVDQARPGGTNNAYARIQYLLPVPGGGRLAFNDTRGILYLTDMDGREPGVYLDLRRQSVGFSNAAFPNEAGFMGFAFHPQFAMSRDARLRQVLHGLQRHAPQRRRRLRGLRRHPRQRHPRVDGERSERRLVCRHVAGGVSRRPIRTEPQRRHDCLQSHRRRGCRRLRPAVHLLRRRRQRPRPAQSWPDAQSAARRHCPHRSARHRRRPALRHPARQSLRRTSERGAGDLGLRPAPSAAVLVGCRRPHVHRRHRPGPDRGDQLGRGRRQLRLAAAGGHLRDRARRRQNPSRARVPAAGKRSRVVSSTRWRNTTTTRATR